MAVELSPDRCNPTATVALPRRKSEAMVEQEETEGLEVRFASEWRQEAHQVMKLKLVLTFLYLSLSM